MKTHLLLLFLISFGYLGTSVFSNISHSTELKSIPRTPDLDSIWKVAQEEIKLDSSTLVINCSFWYNAMPGADNSQTCWSLVPMDKRRYGGNYSDYIPAIAYFIQDIDNKNKKYETFVYDEKKGWMKDHKFYFNPTGVILALYNKKKNEWVYLKKSGPFNMGSVE